MESEHKTARDLEGASGSPPDEDPSSWTPLYQRWIGPDGFHYRALCWAYGMGTLARLTLPDALRDDALAITALWLFGGLLVATTRRIEGWALCAVAALSSLLTGEDQLTQSALLGLWALSAVGVFCFGARARRTDRMNRDLPAVIGVTGALTYAIASLHKLNTGFFNPEISCANGGVRVLGESWQLQWLSEMATFSGWAPLFVSAELGLAVLWLFRPRWALPLAVVMHIPLTVVFAPSFVFVMMVAWVALTPPSHLHHLLMVLRRHWVIISVPGLVLAVASLSQHSMAHLETNWLWSGKEALLWVVLVWVVVASFDAWRLRSGGGVEGVEPLNSAAVSLKGLSSGGRAVLALAVVIWFGNAMTPYLGVKYHHSGAMLSNLRVDQGCWNSLWAPQSVQFRDPYVRITRAKVEMGSKEPPDKEAQQRFSDVVPKKLYGPARLWRLREKWCGGDRVIQLEGTHGGENFEVGNFCAPNGWPLAEKPDLEGYRGFQKNLSADCEQVCIH